MSAHENKQVSGVREKVESVLGPGTTKALMWVLFSGVFPVRVGSGLCFFFFFSF